MQEQFNEYLTNVFEQYEIEKSLKDSINYSLISNGKQLRPILFFSLLTDFAEEKVDNFFCVGAAIEMIHTYSLIHDDLPALDNDDYRRGKLTNHLVFGEDIAILAGDALLTHAYQELLKSPLSAEIKVKMLEHFISAIGANCGMINGQVIDLKNENTEISLEILEKINYQKTARLIMLPLELACIASNRQAQVDFFKEVGAKLGCLFQIQDDYLDLYGKFEEIGKEVGQDRVNAKKTYVDFYTKFELEMLFEKEYSTLISKLADYPELRKIIERIKKRVK
ncbi:MAG: polyprenyl synthetase family protein [Mycoplasmatales bacterium]